MKKVLLLSFLLLTNCTSIRHSQERFFLRIARSQLNALPSEVKRYCNLSLEDDPLSIIPGDKSYYFNKVIHYNLSHKSEIIHEATHFYLQDMEKSCLQEIIATLLEKQYALKREIHWLQLQ